MSCPVHHRKILFKYDYTDAGTNVYITRYCCLEHARRVAKAFEEAELFDNIRIETSNRPRPQESLPLRLIVPLSVVFFHALESRACFSSIVISPLSFTATSTSRLWNLPLPHVLSFISSSFCIRIISILVLIDFQHKVGFWKNQSYSHS